MRFISSKFFYVALLFFAILIVSQSSACNTKNTQRNGHESREKQGRKKNLNPGALPKTVKHPKNNLSSKKKIELGRLLFFDPILSGDKDVACASCHHPSTGYAEYRDLSIGVNGKGLGSKRVFNEPNYIPIMKRNAHTIINTAFNGISTTNSYQPEDAPMFWDSRVNSLEKQAIEPIITLEEMRGNNYLETEILAEIVSRLKSIPEYAAKFKSVFTESEPITEENIGKAIATFERSLITVETRYDKFIAGDRDAISKSEKEGFRLFNRVGCSNCHSGSMFSDYQAHIIGVPRNRKLTEYDKGIDEKYAFRTPSLRNLRFTAPYMHNGRFNSLEDVLEFYEDVSGGKGRHEDVQDDQIDPLIKQLNLTVKDMGSIISFLNTINDSDFDKEIPLSVPSGLPVGGNIH